MRQLFFDGSDVNRIKRNDAISLADYHKTYSSVKERVAQTDRSADLQSALGLVDFQRIVRSRSRTPNIEAGSETGASAPNRKLLESVGHQFPDAPNVHAAILNFGEGLSMAAGNQEA